MNDDELKDLERLLAEGEDGMSLFDHLALDDAKAGNRASHDDVMRTIYNLLLTGQPIPSRLGHYLCFVLDHQEVKTAIKSAFFRKDGREPLQGKDERDLKAVCAYRNLRKSDYKANDAKEMIHDRYGMDRKNLEKAYTKLRKEYGDDVLDELAARYFGKIPT